MRKISILILLVLSTLGQVFSQSTLKLTESQARQTAQSFVNANQRFQTSNLELVSASDIFVYNVGQQGFVIVSGSTVLPPILGYSDQGVFPDLTEAPENVTSWLNHYGEMIAFAEEQGLQPEADIQRQWDEALQGVFTSRNETSVSPLVSTHWNQDCYYNEYCPATSGGGWWGGPCGHVYAGCVACAMAQVMKYWDYPATGFGSHSYTHSQYGEQSANFGATTYHWEQMPNNVYNSNDAVATLMYHCGVSVNMNYSASGSGAQSRDVETAVRSYFGYCGAKYREKSAYSDEAWIAMLKAELDQSHPMYYSGHDGENGHAFVCDGYDNNDRMHFNFGWSGSSDGYYTIYDVNGYNQGQAVVMNFVPMNLQASAEGIIYVTTDGTGDGSSWENATNKLQFASALSSGGGTKVWVKAGVYYGDTSNTEGAFYITESNRVYGGFEGNEAPDYDLSQRDFEKNTTVLDGQGERRVLLQERGFSAGREAIWDGFTIQNGAVGSGAGAYISNYVTLSNCNIIENHATMYGGGIYINSTGGTVRVNLTNCNITDNTSSMGGGVCDRIGATYTNCNLSNNEASTKGGGLYLYNNTEPVFKNCVFANNTAKNAGGMYARGRFTAYNCDFVMNLGTESIGGVFHEERHNKYYNCILWGNVANGQPSQVEGVSDYEYCAVQGGVDGTEIINLPAANSGDEPGGYVRFNHHAQGAGAEYHNNDWSLRSRSICLNAGKPNTTGLGSTDIAGNTRIQKGRVEIGAYESCASLTLIEDAFYESDSPYWFFSRPLTEPGYYTAVLSGADCDSVIGLTLGILAGLKDDGPSTPSTGSGTEGSGTLVVWPNPTKDVLHIDAEGDFTLEIRNLLGQLVMKAENAQTIDFVGFEKGIYFLILNNNNGEKRVVKVVKE
ncbi:MAG: C10 family peptidase [Bacteroidales bacterium]|nr:C10 family peptidase [Bacteroidales bacterium]